MLAPQGKLWSGTSAEFSTAHLKTTQPKGPKQTSALNELCMVLQLSDHKTCPMCSHHGRKGFSPCPKVSKSHCVISQEPFLHSVRTLSSHCRHPSTGPQLQFFFQTLVKRCRLRTVHSLFEDLVKQGKVYRRLCLARLFNRSLRLASWAVWRVRPWVLRSAHTFRERTLCHRSASRSVGSSSAAAASGRAPPETGYFTSVSHRLATSDCTAPLGIWKGATCDWFVLIGCQTLFVHNFRQPTFATSSMRM